MSTVDEIRTRLANVSLETWIAGNDEDSDYSLVGTHDGDYLVSNPVVKLHNEHMAEFIAACNPVAIAELLAERDAAVAQAKQARSDALEEAAKVPRAYAFQLDNGGWGNRFPDELAAIFNASTNMENNIRALARSQDSGESTT